MTIILTLPMIIFIISMLIGWTAFLLGAIKWLLNRQLTSMEMRVESTEKRTEEALSVLSKHKESVTSALSTLRLEFSQKMVCSNHSRMEDNDTRLFKRLDQLHGEFREMLGAINSIKNQVDLMYQHHLNGGK